jgi:hypothetical protein
VYLFIIDYRVATINTTHNITKLLAALGQRGRIDRRKQWFQQDGAEDTKGGNQNVAALQTSMKMLIKRVKIICSKY